MNSKHSNQNGPGQAALDNAQTSETKSCSDIDTYAIAHRCLDTTPFSVEKSEQDDTEFAIHTDWHAKPYAVRSLDEAKEVITGVIDNLNLAFDLEDIETDNLEALERKYRQDYLDIVHDKMERAWNEAIEE